MSTELVDLSIAEVLHASGEVRFRYARVTSPDGSRWLRQGLFREYAIDGVVLSEGNYEAGLEHGVWRDFHPHGGLAATGTYEHGVEVGVWRYWNEQGVEEPSEQRGERTDG